MPQTDKRRLVGRQAVLPAVLGTLLVALPVQLALARYVSEPYPAIFQPTFAGTPERDGLAIVRSAEIKVHFGGTHATVTPVQFLPEDTRVVASSVLANVFPINTPAGQLPEETRRWLAERVVTLFEGRSATRLIIAWTERAYDTETRQLISVKPLQSHVVDLGDQR